MKNVVIIGGDGFCGWPCALHLSAQGHRVAIVDNLSRRKIDRELGTSSLTPIAHVSERIATWQKVSGKRIEFFDIDVARDYGMLEDLLALLKPDTIVHFGEQRAAPYSMRNVRSKRYTVDNNIRGTHNLLAAIAMLELDTHVVHLGTMGVYGYAGEGFTTPEGYLPVHVANNEGALQEREILYPTKPGSVYHLTKSMDQLMFQFYAQNDELRVTDLHQGIVWGTQTEETRLHEKLINRFDYDGDYGTVLNRFLMQAAAGHPLTVHGTGGQTRAFIHIQDTVRCVALAVANPPEKGARVKIMNQVTEQHRVRDLAKMVADLTGAEIAMVDNPRKEAAENDLVVCNDSFLELGLKPTTLREGLLSETVEIAQRYLHRYNPDVVPCLSTWTGAQKAGVVTEEALHRKMAAE